MLMILPRLCCQTSYERVCFRSGYQRLTNKEPCACEGNGARCTLPKINRPDDGIRVAGRSVVGSGLPSQPRPATLIRHCTVVGHYHSAAATQCTVGAMLSWSPECYKACPFYPSLIQKNHLHTLSPDVFSTECCPAGIGSVSRSQCCVI